MRQRSGALNMPASSGYSVLCVPAPTGLLPVHPILIIICMSAPYTKHWNVCHWVGSGEGRDIL